MSELNTNPTDAATGAESTTTSETPGTGSTGTTSTPSAEGDKGDGTTGTGSAGSDPATTKPPPPPGKLTIKCVVLEKQSDQNPRTKAKYVYSAGTTKLLETATLENVRKDIQSRDEAKKIWNLKFCDKTGATWKDDTNLAAYFQHNGDTIVAGKDVSLNVYFKKLKKEEEKKSADLDAAVARLEKQEAASEKLRELFKHATGKDLEHAVTRQLYEAGNFTAATSTDDQITKPADMSEKNWNVVIKNNALLSGHVVQAVVGADKDKTPVVKSIRRAPLPAFVLGTRAFETYELPREPTDKEKKRASLHIPLWQQDDDSYVSVIETDSATQESLTKSGFSDWDVSASGGGSAFGFSVSASVSVSGSTSSATSTDTRKQSSKMTVSYNFPRVRVSFVPNILSLTQECKQDLDKFTSTSTIEDVYNFQQKYGQFFATDIQLGGRLHSTTDQSDIKTAEGISKMSTFKSAASVAFSSPTGAGGSVGAGYSNEDKSDSAKASANSNLSVVWEATGGNTLLANNPPAWCPTVGSYHNWRLVKQEGITKLIDFIGQMPGYAGKANLFNALIQAKSNKDLENAKNALAEEQKKLLEAIPVHFELQKSDGSKWTLLYPDSVTNDVRRETMFNKVAQSGISWAEQNGHESEIKAIGIERDYYLEHGTDVRFAKDLPEGWKKTTTKFMAKTTKGEVVERLYHDTKYEIYDETGEYILEMTGWTPNTLVYGFATFIKKNAAGRHKTYARFQTPGEPKNTGPIESTSELEVQLIYDNDYEGLYTMCDREWYHNAGISWNTITSIRKYAYVDIHFFKVNQLSKASTATATATATTTTTTTTTTPVTT